MTAPFDTNVVPDLLLDRPAFSDSAGLALSVVDDGVARGLVCATSVTTIHYIAAKALGARAANDCVARLLALLAVAPVSDEVCRAALACGWQDYEDAVVHEAARLAGAEYLVTRDQRGFSRATLTVVTPEASWRAARGGGL